MCCYRVRPSQKSDREKNRTGKVGKIGRSVGEKWKEDRGKRAKVRG